MFLLLLPIILPRDDKMTKLVIEACHRKINHSQQWNPGNTWRTQIAILGTEREAGGEESFEKLRYMYESAGKTL